jgi:hypothetical protein
MGFPSKTTSAPLLSSMHATFPTHLILLYLITWIIFHEECWSQSSLAPLRPKYLPQSLTTMWDNVFPTWDVNALCKFLICGMPLLSRPRAQQPYCIESMHLVGHPTAGAVFRNQIKETPHSSIYRCIVIVAVLLCWKWMLYSVLLLKYLNFGCVYLMSCGWTP